MDSADGGRRGYGPSLNRAYYVRYEPLGLDGFAETVDLGGSSR